MAGGGTAGGSDGAPAHHLQPGLASGAGRAGRPTGRQPGAAAGRQLGAAAARAALGQLGATAALRRQLGEATGRHRRRQLGAWHGLRQLGAAARRQQPLGSPGALPRRLLQPHHPRRAQQGERPPACAHPTAHGHPTAPTHPRSLPPSLRPVAGCRRGVLRPHLPGLPDHLRGPEHRVRGPCRVPLHLHAHAALALQQE